MGDRGSGSCRQENQFKSYYIREQNECKKRSLNQEKKVNLNVQILARVHAHARACARASVEIS